MEKINVTNEKLDHPGSGEYIVEQFHNPLEEIPISFYSPRTILYLAKMIRDKTVTEATTWPTYAIAFLTNEIKEKDIEVTDYQVTHEPMPGLICALEIYPYRCREKKNIFILKYEKDKKDPIPIFQWNYEKGGWEKIK